LPEGDVLIHAGDLTNIGSRPNLEQFIYWFMNIKGFDTKIFIAGNHDWCFERKPDWLSQYINDENLSQSDCVYLEDSSFTIESPEFSRPIKFYGSPWQPDFMNWAFNVPRSELHTYWEKIPEDTDVLITHGPPEGILDINMEGESCGCSSLAYHAERVKPLIHVFGHIHEQHGYKIHNGTTYINATTCTRRYIPSNKPIVASLKELDGDFIVNIRDPWNY
jgi:predicted phosphodiesterase